MPDFKMHTANLVAKNLEKLTALFPNCVTEGRNEQGEIVKGVDFELLRQELSNVLIDGEQERYTLNWVGKKESILAANAPIAKTLRPCREESVNFDTTENLFIEGDNLDALKLLQENYLGKVKMIYIDPPYNTGNDFIYDDDFAENIEEFLIRSNQIDEDGNRLIANTESNGRFHSDWLSMMYSRLRLARNLLTDDGVIFISIDDNEQANLKRLCDEVFGEDNFLNAVAVNMKNIAGASGGGEDKRLKKNIETLLIYVKSYDVFNSFKNVYEYREIGELVEEYKEIGKSWKYTSVLVNPGEPNYICSTVDGEGNEIKIYSRENYIICSVSELARLENLSEKEIYHKYASKIFQTAMPQSSIRPRVMEALSNFNIYNDLFSIEYVPRSGRNKGELYEQFYKGDSFRLFAWLKDVSEEIDGILYKKEMQGTYWDLVSETKNLTKEGNIPFPNGKKPIALLKRLLDMQGDKDYLVMDFFSGSGTTAHSIMQLNSEDNGTRKYICVQIAENLDPKDKDQKAAYELCMKLNKPTNIAEISKERIRRAGVQIQFENPDKQIDIGFRVLKIDSSNMKDIYYQPEQLDKTMLDQMVSHIKEDRTAEDLLFQVMLDWGIELSLPIERKIIDGSEVYFVAGNTLVACFDKFTMNVVDEIAKVKPLRVVSTELAIVHDQDKTNIKERFKQLSSDTEVRFL